MRLIAAKFVPRLLTNDQKQQCINVSLELREKANEDPAFVSRIMLGGESWIYGYDPVTKQQSSQRKSPQSPKAKKAQQVRSSTKSMLTVFCFLFFFYVKGIAHCEFVPPITTVNFDFYCDVLRRLQENV
jgi:histone-lysine N-methyltransferase SETMAR